MKGNVDRVCESTYLVHVYDNDSDAKGCADNK